MNYRDETLEYWETEAKKNPYKAICDHVKTKSEFDKFQDSILFYSKIDYHDKVVLDLCCGTGRISRFIIKDVKKYVGVDFSPTMIELANHERASYPHNLRNKLLFLVNDGISLRTLGSNTIDIGLCELAFQHMPKFKTRNYTEEVHRVLKPKGVFVAQIPRLDYYKHLPHRAFSEEEAYELFKHFRITKLISRYANSDAYYLFVAEK